MNDLSSKKKLVKRWFVFLQKEICDQYENLESLTNKNGRKFKKKYWSKINKKEGGGTYFILKNGGIFDKVGVNQSTVSGVFKKEFRKKIPGANKNGKYWASGISVVAHMRNPKIPAIHFNTRFICTSKEWFGGGIDVTPSFNNPGDKIYMEKLLKNVCFRNKKNYKKYKRWCDKYFYLPHHNETRGIGGIFFDYQKEDWKKNFQFIRDVGICFIELSKNLIMRNYMTKTNGNDKKKQLLKRGKYIEFNLLYDRGTKFGLNSGGNLDSILMSIPPKAKWN